MKRAPGSPLIRQTEAVARVFWALGNDVSITLLMAIQAGATTTKLLDERCGYPRTTSWRWLKEMESVGLIVRTPTGEPGRHGFDEISVTVLAADLLRRARAGAR